MNGLLHLLTCSAIASAGLVSTIRTEPMKTAKQIGEAQYISTKDKQTNQNRKKHTQKEGKLNGIHKF